LESSNNRLIWTNTTKTESLQEQASLLTAAREGNAFIAQGIKELWKDNAEMQKNLEAEKKDKIAAQAALEAEKRDKIEAQTKLDFARKALI
jgi:hypothetical protein